ELAGPIGKNTGKARVGQIRICSVAAPVEASANRPPPVQTVFGRSVQAEGMLRLESIQRRQLVASAPEQLRAEQEILINGAAQRLPAQCSVRRVDIGEKGRWIRRGCDARTVSARVGDTEIEIGRFAQVTIGADMPDDA